MRNVAVHLIVVVAAVAGACGDPPSPDKPDEPAPIAPPPYESFEARPCPEDSALTWENFGEPFVKNWCTACHSASLDEEHRAGAPIDVNLDTIDDVHAFSERVWARSGDQNNTMPPAGYAPDPERLQLGEWLACGAHSRDD